MAMAANTTLSPTLTVISPHRLISQEQTESWWSSATEVRRSQPEIYSSSIKLLVSSRTRGPSHKEP